MQHWGQRVCDGGVGRVFISRVNWAGGPSFLPTSLRAPQDHFETKEKPLQAGRWALLRESTSGHECLPPQAPRAPCPGEHLEHRLGAGVHDPGAASTWAPWECPALPPSLPGPILLPNRPRSAPIGLPQRSRRPVDPTILLPCPLAARPAWLPRSDRVPNVFLWPQHTDTAPLPCHCLPRLVSHGKTGLRVKIRLRLWSLNLNFTSFLSGTRFRGWWQLGRDGRDVDAGTTQGRKCE